MLRHALGAALPSKAKHLAKASFGILKLPFLPDRLAFSSRRTVQRVCVRRPHRGFFLTTLVRLYRMRHTVAPRGPSGQEAGRVEDWRGVPKVWPSTYLHK